MRRAEVRHPIRLAAVVHRRVAIRAHELAVDEACANVIEHAYGDDKSKQVMIRAVFDDDTLRIHVIDTSSRAQSRDLLLAFRAPPPKSRSLAALGMTASGFSSGSTTAVSFTRIGGCHSKAAPAS
jgi:anti-sigma regulatory factor (Ser/Thr protein kinase)